MYFSFDFGWYSIHLDIVCLEQGLSGFFLLNGQNLLKCDDSYLSTVPYYMPCYLIKISLVLSKWSNAGKNKDFVRIKNMSCLYNKSWQDWRDYSRKHPKGDVKDMKFLRTVWDSLLIRKNFLLNKCFLNGKGIFISWSGNTSQLRKDFPMGNEKYIYK